jgi:hypothetical protein
MALASVRTKATKEIMFNAWKIVELAQDYKYLPRVKTLSKMGTHVWHITKGLVLLRRTH